MSKDLHKMAREGQFNLLQQSLVEDSTDISKALQSVDADHRTLLHNAVAGVPSSPQTVEMVLSFVAPLEHATRERILEAQDDSGNTALILAASIGNKDIAALLVRNGANVLAGNTKGVTALHYAASKGFVEIGELLISHGADVNTKDKANQIPLHRAASTGSEAFVRLILRSTSPTRPNKPRLNQQDRIGNTPLHLAIESGHASIAVLLIENGADRYRINADGQCPEEVDGLLGTEGQKALQYIADNCGAFEKA